jgi:DMSO/TMAO reductase YedYZ molybdopterin-dependent catalytic subunit
MISEKTVTATSVVAGVASAMLLVAGTALTAGAEEAAPVQPSSDAQASVAQEALAQVQAACVVDASRASFAWDQATITPNWYIRDVFSQASATLCSSTSAFVSSDPEDWVITVDGDVENEFSATFGEMAQDQSVTQTMTCTCGGNPADGRASVTAQVTGIPVAYMVSRAGAASDVNTITFVCADGSEVSMPLGYVVGRHGVLTFDVNGESLSESMGGTNQLWLAGTAGNYFVRDVTSIEVTHEDEPPEAPSAKRAANSPNVGVTSALVG